MTYKMTSVFPGSDMSSSIPTIRELFAGSHRAGRACAREFLAQQHCPDPERRAQVEPLIAADEDAGEPLQTGAIDRMASAMTHASRLSLPAGSRVGPFELQEVIGEGGSSTVFHAVREVEGVTQHVALKLHAVQPAQP